MLRVRAHEPTHEIMTINNEASQIRRVHNTKRKTTISEAHQMNSSVDSLEIPKAMKQVFSLLMLSTSPSSRICEDF